MTYYDSLDKNKYNELAVCFEYFNPRPLDKIQIEHSDMVASDILSNYAKREFVDDEDISYSRLISGTNRLFDEVGLCRVSGAAKSVLSSSKYGKGISIYDFDFTVISDIAFNGGSYFKIPNTIILPEYYTLSSIHFLAHEICHVLKEFNPLECMNVYTLEEVIPITIELITAYEKRRFDVFRKRELLIKDTADLYLKLSNDRKYISNEDMLGFMACYRKSMMYLNSFYYAMKLFSKYLEEKEETLEFIEMVLTGECTTERLMDILFCESDSSYDIGISEFKNKLN